MLLYADISDMADIKTFSGQLGQALDAKAQWYDINGLPALLDDYRMLHTCVKNLYDFFLKKSLIKKDPYKLDKKISDVIPPENTAFAEGDRGVVIGMRFSDYDSTLDFLCNYYKFSVSQLTLPSIRKLVEFNNAFLWTSFSVNSPKPNTRGLASLVADGKKNADQFSASLLTDSISKASKAMASINTQLKDYTEFQKEYYKGTIRRRVFEANGFDYDKANASADDELQMIKKVFPTVMGKTPFYNELVDEIIQEDHAENKDALQQQVLLKLGIEEKKESKHEVKIDTKELLMDSVRALGAMAPQIDLAAQKIKENHDVLQAEHNTFFDKIKRALRKAFNIAEKPLFYQIVLSDESSGTKHREKVNYQLLMTDLGARTRRYAASATKESPGYERIYAQPEEKVLEYVNNQIFDCQKLLKLLNGLDEFFKQAPQIINRPKIKGLKMEITSIKNCVVKANQYRADYVAYVEEEAQFKKLGITNAN